MKRMPMTVHEIFAENLSASGYDDKWAILAVLNKLTDEDIKTLSTAASRTCEKVGIDGFDCEFLHDEDDRYENIVKKPEGTLPRLSK